MPLVLTLVLSLLKLVSGQWEVIGPDKPIQASVGEDVMFSCFLTPKMSAEAMEVRFFRNHISAVVHFYRDGKDLEDMQMPTYQGRTEFLKNSIVDGHVSLRMKNITPLDAGLYGCSFSSRTYYQEATWELQVSETFFQPSPWRLASIFLGLLCFSLCVCIIGQRIFFSKCQRKLQVELDWRRQQEQTEWRDAREHTVELTLDTDSAHPQVCISNLREVTYMDVPQEVPYSEKRFTRTCVVASQCFSSGKHYWEVYVGKKKEWCLGVSLDEVDRKMEHVTLSPNNGHWIFEQSKQDQYISYNPHGFYLFPRTPPTRVGIFLDYEGGTISFFNINYQSLIYTLTHQFEGLLRPYIQYWPCSGGNQTLIVICPISWGSEAEASSQSVPTFPDTDNSEPFSQVTTPFLYKTNARGMNVAQTVEDPPPTREVLCSVPGVF